MRPLARGTTAAAALAWLATGCLSTGGLLDARGTGTSRCYRVSYDALWPTLEEAVRWTGLVLERSNRENGFLLARNYEPEVQDPEDMALDADQGERVAAFVEAEGPDVWRVELVSRPIFALDPTPRDWTRPVFEALEARLGSAARAPHADLAACVRAYEPAIARDSLALPD